ncbi:hypothetical protein TTHERM_00540200 (macronuclear) [Tetrahymena thermophila SB210]|uniref:Uncharacterized protein n=1 Tax=Tetrahymena thermophila (strain SB210) TaxID=312017 RepID=I7MDJ0_TETTS|nr:hypothetical protein TTHERM_00540200 [Tetrahymena thermophila SB210]EAR87700.3 hypothetical protein TTHERM_00540200 [Tetrahymena thermophila SB210]|eukprot:XP_001007945.3 hypothetical protein TTHERM_00540200 [Tetrahymena thermophila SB210]
MQQQPIILNNMPNQFQYNQNILANTSMKMIQPFVPSYFQIQQQQPRISQFQHDMCEIDKKIVKCAFKKKRMLKRLLTWIALLQQEKELEKKKLDFQIYQKKYTKNNTMQDANTLQKINNKSVKFEEENQILKKKSSQENKQPSQSSSDVNQSLCKYTPQQTELPPSYSSNSSQDINQSLSQHTLQKISVTPPSQEVNQSLSQHTPQKTEVIPSQDVYNKLHDQKTQKLKNQIIQSNEDASFEETPKFNQKNIQSNQGTQDSCLVEKRDHQKLSDTSRKQNNSVNDSQVTHLKRSKVSEFDCEDSQLNINREKNRDHPQKNMKKSDKSQCKYLQKQKQKPYQQTEKTSQKALQKMQKEKHKSHKNSEQELEYNRYKYQSYKQVKVEENNFNDEFEKHSDFDFEFEEITKNFNQKQQIVDKNLNLIQVTNNFQNKSLQKSTVEENQNANNNNLQKQEQTQQDHDKQVKDLDFQTPVKSTCENQSSKESSLNKEQSREKQFNYSTEKKVQNQNCHLLNSPNESAIESTQPSQNEQFQSSLMSQSNDQTQLISHFSNTKIEQLEEQLIQFISEGQRDLDSVLEKAYHLRESLGLTKKDLTLSEKWYKQFLQKYQIEFEE